MDDEDFQQAVEDNDGVPVAEDAPADDVPSWLDGADEDQREFAKSIGAYDDPVRALKSAMGAEQARRASQSERDELRAMLQQVTDQMGTQQQEPVAEPQMFNEDGPPEYDALVNAFGGNEAAAIDFIAQQRAQEAAQFAVQQAMEQFQGQVAPLAQQAEQSQLQQAAADLSSIYADDYERLAPQVAEFIQQNPEYNNARGMWSAFGLVAAHDQRQARAAAAKKAAADNVGGRGSGGASRRDREADAASALMDAVFDAGSRPNGYDGI